MIAVKHGEEKTSHPKMIGNLLSIHKSKFKLVLISDVPLLSNGELTISTANLWRDDHGR